MYVFEVIKKLPQKCQEDLEKLRNKKRCQCKGQTSLQNKPFIKQAAKYSDISIAS